MVDEEEYEGTPGLWELIVSKNLDDKIIMRNDFENYKRLMIKTSALHRDMIQTAITPKVVRVSNRINFLVSFGKIGKSMRERGLYSERS